MNNKIPQEIEKNILKEENICCSEIPSKNKWKDAKEALNHCIWGDDWLNRRIKEGGICGCNSCSYCAYLYVLEKINSSFKEGQKEMTDELKTLKDIKKCASEIISEKQKLKRIFEYADVEELRQEAIKWVKDCIEKSWEMDEYYWIEFFNLTEEELKDD
ncbi:MAG: hypothetical protein PHS54_02870 [Clostridia bacterium]|nr:hypothetical protein [Clostridia bacterium]